MKRKQRKSLPWRRFGYVILIIIKFVEILLWFYPRIINALRSYIKHSKECFIRYPNTSKSVKKTRLRLVFSTHFLVFGYLMKHSSSCLIYYLNRWKVINGAALSKELRPGLILGCFCWLKASYSHPIEQKINIPDGAKKIPRKWDLVETNQRQTEKDENFIFRISQLINEPWNQWSIVRNATFF